MATQTFTATYSFEYRFKCEHCGQISQWETDSFREQTEYKDSDFESEESRLFAENEFNKEFAKKVPQLKQEVEDGKYNAVFEGLKCQCTKCKKWQSWGKAPDISGINVSGVFWGMLIIVSLLGSVFNATKPIMERIFSFMGCVCGTLLFLFSLNSLFKQVKEIWAFKRDTENVTAQNKPEFRWPNIPR